jgi:hypothetical protein
MGTTVPLYPLMRITVASPVPWALVTPEIEISRMG